MSSSIRRAWPLAAAAVITAALAMDFLIHPEEIGIDFHTYLAASLVGFTHGWAHIYDQVLVAGAQAQLVSTQRTQPFLSPPTVAWLTLPFLALPYDLAYYAWSVLAVGAYAAAVAWSTTTAGRMRWLLVAAAVAPWWVLHAVHVGQVIPFMAAGLLVAWRLLRENRQLPAGWALAVIALKPNTAFLLPLLVLASGRLRAFLSVAASGLVIMTIAAATLGTGGISSYLAQLTGPLPAGANYLALEGSLDLHGMTATLVRAAIVLVALAAGFLLRRSPGMVLAAAVVGSLLTAPYLHASDLCLLSAAAVMVWDECPVAAWRAGLAIAWLVASPFADRSHWGPTINRWPLIELLFLGGLAGTAVMVWAGQAGGAGLALTAPTDGKTEDPAPLRTS